MPQDLTASAAQHARLLTEIQSVDYAPPTLKQVQSHLANAQKQLDADKEALAKRETETKKEFKDLRNIRERTSKRFWVKLKHPVHGKEVLEQKETKEEKEYMEAFAIEQHLKAEIETLSREMEGLSRDVAELTTVTEKHDRLQKELRHFYESVFGGPTPNHPEEDAAEHKAKAAVDYYNQVQSAMTNASRAFSLLKQAERALLMASQAIGQAQSASTMDMFGGGAMMDMMERNALAEAQRYADQARTYVIQARQLQPGIQELQSVKMPMGNIMSDMFFDNVFTDMAFHQKIQAAASRLEQRRRELHAIVASFSAHLQALQDDSRKAETDLNKTRRDLEKVRREILLGYIAGQQEEQLEEGPPEYVPPPRYYGNPFADGLASREA